MRIKLLAIMALAALTILALACGRDDDSEDGLGDVPDQEATTAPADDGAGDEADVSVAIESFTFDPAEFTVAADEAIVIGVANADETAHTFTVYTDEEFTEAQGAAVSVRGAASGNATGTFAAGEYYFRCEIHPAQMQGSFTAE